MSTTTQFTTFSDLYLGLLKALRTDSSNAATVEQAKRYINTALLDMHVGFADKVTWAIRSHSFLTETTFTTTVESVNFAGSTPPNNTPFRGYNMDNPDGNTFSNGQKTIVTSAAATTSTGLEGEVKLTSSTSADPAVIDVYGSDMAVGDAVRIYQNDITLPADFMQMAGNIVKIGDRRIRLIGRIDFRHQFAGEHEIGRPIHATLIDSFDVVSGLDNRKIRLYPLPNTVERGHISYVTKNLVIASDGTWRTDFSDDNDEPIVPLRYRHAIFFHALYNWYRDRKDDTRSQEAKMEYESIMMRVVNDTEPGQSRMSISPRVSGYRRRSKRPYRGRGSRRFDVNGGFDRLED